MQSDILSRETDDSHPLFAQPRRAPIVVGDLTRLFVTLPIHLHG
jgi:hypothetical protein